jgi:hypothetical protein
LSVVIISAPAVSQGETIDTRIGKLSFTHDFANGSSPRNSYCTTRMKRQISSGY